MALQFTSTAFKKDGYALSGLVNIYAETKATFPANSTKVHIGFILYEDNTKANKLGMLDGFGDVILDTFALLTLEADYWTAVTNGALHNLIIAALEERNADWVGQITKVVPADLVAALEEQAQQ